MVTPNEKLYEDIVNYLHYADMKPEYLKKKGLSKESILVMKNSVMESLINLLAQDEQGLRTMMWRVINNNRERSPRSATRMFQTLELLRPDWNNKFAGTLNDFLYAYTKLLMSVNDSDDIGNNLIQFKKELNELATNTANHIISRNITVTPEEKVAIAEYHFASYGRDIPPWEEPVDDEPDGDDYEPQ